MDTLVYARILELKIADIHRERWNGNIKITETGQAPVVRYRTCHAQVSILYKGKVMVENVSGWCMIEPAIESADLTIARYGIDDSSEAEVIVRVKISDRTGSLIKPDTYQMSPHIESETRLIEDIVFDEVVYSSKGGIKVREKLLQAERLLEEGEGCRSQEVMKKVSALFGPVPAIEA